MTHRAFCKELIDRCYNKDVEWLTQVKEEDIFKEIVTSKAFRNQFISIIDEVHEDVLRLILESGFDLNRHDGEPAPDGIYPLDACVSSNSATNAQVLLEHGADPNLCDALNSLSYMRSASAEDQIKMCELLLKHGADINRELPNLPGFTPLVRAIEKGHEELAAYLISKGARLPEFEDECAYELNLDTFQERLELAIESCWRGMEQKFPGETFILFALETDDDLSLINPVLDSVQSIERDRSDRIRRGYRPKADSIIGQILFYSDSQFYSPDEGGLNELSMELNCSLDYGETEEEGEQRKKRVLTIFEDALRNCDRKGVFGTGSRREEVLVMVSFMDPENHQWEIMNGIVERLNPAIVTKQYLDSFKV